MKPLFKHLPIISALLSAQLITPSAFAEDTKTIELDEVIVSADFRPAKASETAVSLTEIDEETIEARGAQHIEDVLNLAPNVNVSAGASRGRFFQIRGMGSRSQFNNAPLTPSVGLVIDGIDFSRTGGAATMFDIESVEVLRGPQGTRFGSNGLAGTINVRSKEPTKEFNLHVEGGIAEYNERNLGIAVGGTLIEDRVLGRAAIYSHQSDGYMDNDFLNRDDTQKQDELTLRGKLKFLVSDDFTVDVSYLHLNIDNGYDGFTLDNSRNSLSDDPGKDTQKTNAFAVKTNWDASNAVTVQSELTYLNADTVYSYDADWGFDGQFAPALFPYIGSQRFERDRENFSMELRALSGEDGRIFNGMTDWTIGFYHFDQDEAFDEFSDFGVFGPGPQYNGDYDTKNTSIYGQLDTHLTDKLTLVTGVRAEYFEAKYNDSNAVKISNYEALFGGKLGLNYQMTTNHLLYTSLARGYKPGGVNGSPQLAKAQQEFDTEYNVNFEVGAKSSWLNNRLLTNINLFYTDRKDAQVTEYIQTGPDFTSYSNNAASATHKGIEASMDWLATDKVRLMASIGLLDAQFDKYETLDKDGNPRSVSGRDVAHAPDYTYNLGAEFYVNDAWTLRANVEGKDAFFFSDNNEARSISYSIVNASAEYTHDAWTVRVWARNLFDKDYYNRGFFFANNPGNGYADQRFVQYAPPRVAGITVSYDY